MNGIEVADMQVKAGYIMKIGLLLKTGELGETEAAQKLGLSREELTEYSTANSAI